MAHVGKELAFDMAPTAAGGPVEIEQQQAEYQKGNIEDNGKALKEIGRKDQEETEHGDRRHTMGKRRTSSDAS